MPSPPAPRLLLTLYQDDAGAAGGDDPLLAAAALLLRYIRLKAAWLGDAPETGDGPPRTISLTQWVYFVWYYFFEVLLVCTYIRGRQQSTPSNGDGISIFAWRYAENIFGSSANERKPETHIFQVYEHTAEEEVRVLS